MALQTYRTEVNNGAYVNTDFFMNTTGEAGCFVVYDTSNSGVGASSDDTGAIVKYATAAQASGEGAAGVLLMDVVNKDLAKWHLNAQKREGQIGGKVALLKRGVITTNAISGGVNPVAGNACYGGSQGFFTTAANSNTNVGGSPRVGTFISSRSSDGYVKIDVNIV